MNRASYFSYIEEKINTLATRVNSRGRLNILDLHLYSEDLYRDLLNKLYGWSLVNANANMHNVESIDLIDQTNLLVIQVSATNTKQKIESSLSKDSIKQYKDQNCT
ncbi:MAG: SMEK domain-containing protein, partial [Tannerella sp.]|nr:SMEK domain-containing protein [Tannerella sp.]